MTLARLIETTEVGVWYGDTASLLGSHENHMAAYEAFNGSLDAAKRLHDALLPGWWATMRYSTRPLVTVGDVDDEFMAQDDCLSRAWLLAILRAMEGRDG